MRSMLIFAVIQLLSFMLGVSDPTTIAIGVLVLSVLIFASVYVSALVKDRIQKKRFSKTVFDL
ncbi:MAG TPA: hypothetical protein PKD67_08900 [Ignavibacteriaceae bacterium]|nr:hypothetical protein [Ignavibacteriaceae bacterium]